jgi:hypothetical protein
VRRLSDGIEQEYAGNFSDFEKQQQQKVDDEHEI